MYHRSDLIPCTINIGIFLYDKIIKLLTLKYVSLITPK